MTRRLFGAALLSLGLLSIRSPQAKAGDVYASAINGQGIFSLNSNPNVPFAPRGVNFDRLADPTNGPRITFEPSSYVQEANSGNIDAILQYIAGSGYNYVRVFLDCPYAENGFPNAQVAANDVPGTFYTEVGDFLQRAANQHLRVQLTFQDIPANFRPPNGNGVDDENNYLLNQSWQQAVGLYLVNLLSHIQQVGYYPQAISAIFAIDIKNELHARDDEAPFNQTSGYFYYNNSNVNLSDKSARQSMIDNATQQFVNNVSQIIKSSFPSIMIAPSVVVPLDLSQSTYDGGFPTSGESNVHPVSVSILNFNTNADYVDIHLYPHTADDSDIDSRLQSAKVQQTSVWTKPLLMGEFGAFQSDFSNDQGSAANTLRNHMALSCSYGYTGWALWTWDPQTPPSGTLFWTATAANGAVNGAISPAGLLSPCPLPSGYFRTSAGAIGYSNYEPGNTPAQAAYCIFDTYANYQRLSNNTDPNTIPLYPRLPATLPYQGVCSG